MIGQSKNRSFIDTCVDKNSLPRFLLLLGPIGSGKRTLCEYIKQKTGYELIYFSPTVDSVRTLIRLAYEQTNPIIYVLTDADKLSANAENALLKVAEEPPTKTHIILTANNDTLLPTIYSRGTKLIMEPYTEEEKRVFCRELAISDDIETKISIADNLGDIVDIANSDYAKICKYCDSIIANISKSNIGSALRIATRLKLKTKDADNADLFDVNLFVKILLYKYFQLCKTCAPVELRTYSDKFNAVYKAKKELAAGHNKQYVIDEMLLNLVG